eukprot:916248_1
MKFGEQMSDLAVASVVFEILQRNGIRSRSRCDKAFTETLSYSRINLKKPVELIFDPGSVTGEDLDDSWSEEANQLFEKFRTFHLQLHSQSTREKPVPLSPQFVYDFIKSLVLRKRGISNIGSSILKFSNLQKLNVGDNHIVSLENLPQSLEILNAYNNRITSISCSAECFLLHAGLGYNRLETLSDILPWSNTLHSLDLCFNRLSDIVGVCETLSQFRQLRFLYLMGNPLSLLPWYVPFVVARLPQLSRFDGRELSDELRADCEGQLSRLPHPITQSKNAR